MNQNQSKEVKIIVHKLMISTAVGLVMAAMTYLGAWYNFRDEEGFCYAHETAFRRIDLLKHELAKYWKNHGHYPETLSEPDPWNNLFEYRVEGDRYTLISFGRDGRPGGEGLDRDIDAAKLPPRPKGRDERWRRMIGSPSLWQFTFGYPTRGFRLSAILSGIFSFFACFLSRTETPQGLIGVLVGLGLTLAACLWVTIGMCVIHVPSHH